MNKPVDLKGLVLDPVTNDQRYIGSSEPRHGARRLIEGQGTYVAVSYTHLTLPTICSV